MTGFVLHLSLDLHVAVATPLYYSVVLSACLDSVLEMSHAEGDKIRIYRAVERLIVGFNISMFHILHWGTLITGISFWAACAWSYRQ